MKRTLNTIPLSKRKYYMSNFFIPRINHKKPVISKSPFVGYEAAYRNQSLKLDLDSKSNDVDEKIDLNDSTKPINTTASTSNSNISLTLPAPTTNPFAMFKPHTSATVSISNAEKPLMPLQTLETYKLAFDGCSKGNPGRAGAGAVIYEGTAEIWSDARYVGDKETNNVAEYTGLIMGLHEALRRNIARLLVQGDSELVIKQMKGIYAVKSDNIKNYHDTAKGLAAQFKWIEFRHVYRNDNKRADELSNQGLIRNVKGSSPAPVSSHSTED